MGGGRRGRHTFASLAIRNFRLRFIGAVVGNTGTWMQRVAQDWLVLTGLTANSGLAVGTVTALQFGPSILLSPVAGLIADRVDRRKFLILTQILQAVLAFALGALVLTGAVRLWHVYALAAALGSVTALDAPANQTFAGELVPPRLLANAVALNAMSFNVARLLGPALAGWLIQAIGPGWVFAVNGASFGATVAALLLIRPAELRTLPAAPRAKGQIRAGITYIRRRGDLKLIIAVVGVVSCLGMNSQLTMAVMTTGFGREAGSFGLLGSFTAVGAVAGSLVAARRERPRVRLVIASALAFAAASGLSAVAPSYWLYAASGVAVGAATLTLITAANATLQLSTDPTLRGRVLSLYQVVFLGSTLVGAPFIGWVAQAWGPRWSIGVGAIAALLAGLLGAAWAASRWRVRLRFESGPPPHLGIFNPTSGEEPPG